MKDLTFQWNAEPDATDVLIMDSETEECVGWAEDMEAVMLMGWLVNHYESPGDEETN